MGFIICIMWFQIIGTPFVQKINNKTVGDANDFMQEFQNLSQNLELYEHVLGVALFFNILKFSVRLFIFPTVSGKLIELFLLSFSYQAFFLSLYGIVKIIINDLG